MEIKNSYIVLTQNYPDLLIFDKETNSFIFKTDSFSRTGIIKINSMEDTKIEYRDSSKNVIEYYIGINKKDTYLFRAISVNKVSYQEFEQFMISVYEALNKRNFILSDF